MQEVAVCGPRYWPQRVADEQDVGRAEPSGAPEGALAALYRSHALYVQRKSGALSYVDDPSGVRSLLSTAFHKVRYSGYTTLQDLGEAICILSSIKWVLLASHGSHNCATLRTTTSV